MLKLVYTNNSILKAFQIPTNQISPQNKWIIQQRPYMPTPLDWPLTSKWFVHACDETPFCARPEGLHCRPSGLTMHVTSQAQFTFRPLLPTLGHIYNLCQLFLHLGTNLANQGWSVQIFNPVLTSCPFVTGHVSLIKGWNPDPWNLGGMQDSGDYGLQILRTKEPPKQKDQGS